MDHLVEGQFGTGGIKTNPIKHWIGNQLVPKAMASIAFDWNKGCTKKDTSYITVKNQGQQYSCGRQAATNLFQLLLKCPPVSGKSGYGNFCASGGGCYRYTSVSGSLVGTSVTCP